MPTEHQPDHDRGPRPGLDDLRRGDAGGGWIETALRHRLVVSVLLVALVGAGAWFAPFGWLPSFERSTVAVDAIPDIGENQQIVYAAWPGRSPRDVEDQLTYPLSTALLGTSHVRTVRGFSMFGLSMVYVVFGDTTSFEASRARLLERLQSLPEGTLPAGVRPMLGPEATALGQIYGYTLQGRSPEGAPVGGWDLDELRTIQDYVVRYALSAAGGVAEVASIGGYVRAWQINVDPMLLRSRDLSMLDVHDAITRAHLELGGGTTELNGVDYTVRGVGLLRSLEDIELVEIVRRDGAPVLVRDVATVAEGPEERTGALDIGGAEAVGGIVAARRGANPLQTIEAVEREIARLAPALPSRVLDDGTVSRVTIVPFYSRAPLIRATIGTLERALTQQVLITALVVLLMLLHLRSSLLVSLVVPGAALLTFVAMRLFSVEANVVALAGVAIAIGTMVDMGIVVSEAIVRREAEVGPDEPVATRIAAAVREVSGAVTTAAATTLVSFLPVFLLEGPEGRMFTPLAFTKTWAIVAALIMGLVALPLLASVVMTSRKPGPPSRGDDMPDRRHAKAGAPVATWARRVLTVVLVIVITVLLARDWRPLGAGAPLIAHVALVAVFVGVTLGSFRWFETRYGQILGWVLRNRALFLVLPATVVLVGITAWFGFDRTFSWLPDGVRRLPPVVSVAHAMPGLGREFMPQLDEGAFLYMPSTMPHASIGSALDMASELGRLLENIPEVERAIGKVGRADSALDPAPVAMIETIITYRSEYIEDERGRVLRFAVDDEGAFLRDDQGALIPSPRGRPYRAWRDHIRTVDDLWGEISAAAQVPGLTGAPLLQPISARVVMLQSGIRAPMAVRLAGSDLEDLARAASEIERLLRDVPGVAASSVIADRPVGRPYLELTPNRLAMAQYGVTMEQVQRTLESAVGGSLAGVSVDGRQRVPIRVRYVRERRQTPEDILEATVRGADGALIPLSSVATLDYVPGPDMLRSENAQLVVWVMFDRAPGIPELTAVDNAREALERTLAAGELAIPDGVTLTLAGSWENAQRAGRRLMLVVPLVLGSILLLLVLQLRSTLVALMVFAAVAVALSGGMLLLWAWGQPWFLDVTLAGVSMRDVFHVTPANLSVAVWVGFIALFGIATDDGVLMATFLQQEFRRPIGDASHDDTRNEDPLHEVDAPQHRRAESIARIIAAGRRRVRACLMTTATTLLALLPVLTSTGTGADIMIPMAIPVFGGMAVALVTVLVVPVLYSFTAQHRLAGPAAPVGDDAPNHPIVAIPDGQPRPPQEETR